MKPVRFLGDSLKAWPDVSPVLELLKGAGIRLAFLSNATPKILDAGIKRAGFENVFEYVVSTDKIKIHKPDPRAYDGDRCVWAGHYSRQAPGGRGTCAGVTR